MTPEQVAQVFDRFYRADKSGQISGTGLGMSIVKEIIELHHGHITIESNLGRGTRISLFLPLAQPG
jgi:signal transduction histidine kinase